MPKFRKKPIVIEAIQWDGTSQSLQAINTMGCWPHTIVTTNKNVLIIKTLEGDHEASVGDFIIKGVAGEFYPCKPDIFAKTYEEVD